MTDQEESSSDSISESVSADEKEESISSSSSETSQMKTDRSIEGMEEESKEL